MNENTPITIADEVERYLRTGDADMMGEAWPGGIVERGRQQRADLRCALVEEVRRLANGRRHEPVPREVGFEFTRAKVEPMVRGLFPKAEQDIVLATLERSVVYVTSETIEPILTSHRWDRSAWDLANLYLLSVGAKLLGKNAPRVVGISEETTCYVSPEYFAEDDPFADFIVHEAAHIFHNCKRRTVGLPATRWREWLLDIEFRKRETFAYACEAYSRVLAEAPRLADRPARIDAFAEDPIGADQTVDPAELLDILRDAAQARNGWKRILARCAPRPPGTGPAATSSP